MADEIRYCTLPGNSLQGTWDIYHDGQYVTTEPGQDAAERALDALRRCAWAYYDFHATGIAPLELIARERERRGRIVSRLGRFKCGRVLFKGELSNGDQFCYEIYRKQLAESILAALRPSQSAAEPPPAPQPVVANAGGGAPRMSATSHASRPATAAKSGQASAATDGHAKGATVVQAKTPALRKPKQKPSAQLSMFDE